MTKTFEQITSAGDALLVVDGINLGWRWKHLGSTDFCDDYIKTVESLKRSYKASHVIVTCDRGASTYRKGIYPEYKQNRRDKQALQTEAEKLAFEAFFREFEHTMQTVAVEGKYPLLRFQGVEADDVCAYICNKVRDRDIWLISSDKDYDLLINNHVSRFSYVTRKETTISNWHDHYDFEPEDYISIKCLMGDSGDNVPGVPGIGPIRASTLVREYGSCYDIIASIPISGKYKYIEALNSSRDQLILNYRLMDLVTYCAEAIGVENCNKIDETLKNYLNV
jgi:5'-3' exonuclease